VNNSPYAPGNINEMPVIQKRKKGIQRSNDIELEWVSRSYPDLEMWRGYAVEWMKGETRSVSSRLNALVVFLEKYLIKNRLPLDPLDFLSPSTILPDFYQSSCPNSKIGLQYNNIINSFLDFIILRYFSKIDDSGRATTDIGVRNPIKRMSTAGLPKLDESVHSPLPFGYINELREMLAEGKDFSDWKLAQNALGAEIGKSGRVAPDWFPITESDIDINDPDCVWRRRPVGRESRLEMWSPARWVALLVKLILPIRTLQARMLDSGEADTFRYQRGEWILNKSGLAEGNESKPLQQGVFRRGKSSYERASGATTLYINTNKTADISRSGAEKGYLLPWLSGGSVHQDVVFWLEKLRNWQEKYNPIKRRTSWSELDGRHIQAKSAIQLESFPRACFLFRLREAVEGERHLPIRESGLDFCWFSLLEAFGDRLAKRGETLSNGSHISLLPPLAERRGYPTTLFPLHSLRVSLITALALEGNVPFPILQKLAGHSRLLMTLYYTKPGSAHIRDVLNEAAQRLESKKAASIQNFLLDTEYDQIIKRAIANSSDSLAAALPVHKGSRNAVGWMPMHHGICLVGGNTSESDSNGSIGGCYNGGPNIGPPSMPKYGPVPGGSRNCVRCRWFVTEPHYLPSLVAHFNNISYHFDEARNTCLEHESNLLHLKKSKADAEQAGVRFSAMDSLRNAERVWETGMKKFSDLAEDIVACYKLVDRCRQSLDYSTENKSSMLAVGTMADVRVVLTETDSELLQLSGICSNLEIYPDLNSGKAILRRSQLLDAALYKQKITPVFMTLSETEQLKIGNTFIKRIATVINREDLHEGVAVAVSLIDAGENLSARLGVDIKNLILTTSSSTSPPMNNPEFIYLSGASNE
jgi:hypothetical protein